MMANGTHEVRYAPPRCSILPAALLDDLFEHPG